MTVTEMARKGGVATAKAQSKAELRKWARGRPADCAGWEGARTAAEAAGRRVSQAECASVLGVSVRTVSRAVAQMKRGENEHHLRGSIVLAISACSKAGTGVFFDDLYYIPV
jgi:hypothetical protein